MFKTILVDTLRMFLTVLAMLVTVGGLWLALALLWPAIFRPDNWEWLLFPTALVFIGGVIALVASPIYAIIEHRQRTRTPDNPRPVRAALLTAACLGVVLVVVLIVDAAESWGARSQDLSWIPDAILVIALFTAAAALFLSAGTLVTRRQSPGLAALVGAVAAAAVVWLAASAMADARGASKLAALRAKALPEIAAERLRLSAIRMPVVSGEPIDDNAAPRYRKLFQTVTTTVSGSSKLVAALSKAASAGPLTPIDLQVASTLIERQADLLALREAVRCTRADWGFDYKFDYASGTAEVPSLHGVRELANLLVVEGHQHAQAGDVRGAAERYLEVVRLGSDLGSFGYLGADLAGLAIARQGATALGRLVASGGRDVPLDFIVSTATRLEPALPSTLAGLRGERLSLPSLEEGLKVDAGQDFEQQPVPWMNTAWARRFIPYRLLIAEGVAASDPSFRRLEALAEEPSHRVYEPAAYDLFMESQRLRNPVMSALPSLGRIRLMVVEAQAGLRLAVAAVRIEQARTAGGFPADAKQIDLPVDPHDHPNRLLYAATERGYRLWSVGMDHKDNKGRGDDLLVERLAAR